MRAELLLRAGRAGEARTAYDVALAACTNEAEARHLANKRAALPGACGGSVAAG